MTGSPSDDGLDGIDWLLLAGLGLERAQEEFSETTAERILDVRGTLGRIRSAAVHESGLKDDLATENRPFALNNHLRMRTKRLRDHLAELEADDNDE